MHFHFVVRLSPLAGQSPRFNEDRRTSADPTVNRLADERSPPPLPISDHNPSLRLVEQPAALVAAKCRPFLGVSERGSSTFGLSGPAREASAHHPRGLL